MSSVLYFLQAVLWVAGYGFLLPVPRRFGMFGQVLVMLGLAVLNMLLVFILQAAAGARRAMGIVMIPLVTPEIAMTEYNMERSVPITFCGAGRRSGRTRAA